MIFENVTKNLVQAGRLNRRMDPTVNKTTFKDLRNVTNIDVPTSSIVSYFLHVYAYLIIGSMLLLINISVFLMVMIHKALRTPYLILAVVFFNNALTGMSAILTGMKRLIVSTVEEQYIVHYDCVLNVPIFLLTTFFLNGWSLLMSSAERFFVIAYPTYYYIHTKQIIYSLIVIQYTTAVIAVTSAAPASLTEPIRHVSHFCVQEDVYSSYFYVALVSLNSWASLFSIILMFIVAIILQKKFGTEFFSIYSHNRNLIQFLKNQIRYTQTALFFCYFTFCFVVVPSIVQCIHMMDPNVKSQSIVIYCAYFPLLNSFNMVAFFMYRQKDLQDAAIHSLKWLFGKRKHSVQSVTPIVRFAE
uniref:G-protein coupled receptors family 1 profile domain-containing protein n=1 Tax=Onchocerca volvulus TaxID=6282 RepID=A0A8R1XLR9_ONCVO